MREVEEQLRRYGAALERQLTRGLVDAAVWEAIRHRRRRRSRAVLVAAAMVAAVVVGVVIAFPRDERSQVRTSGPAAGAGTGVFSTPTGVVLLLSDGVDGVTAVDLDRRLAGRRMIAGQRVGDQPFRLAITGDHFVVGWDEIYAAPLSGGPSVRIAAGAVFVPAAEPGQVWVITWDGGGIGRGHPRLERISVDGTRVFTAQSFDTDELIPLLGVPGGLAVQTAEGVAIWQASTGELTQQTRSGPPGAVASNGRHLAWCEATCATTHVISLARVGPSTAIHLSEGRQQLALSPDGRSAAILRPRDGGAELVRKDLTTGEELVVAEALDQHGALQWSPDGAQLLYVANEGRHRTRIGRYTAIDGRWETRSIPIEDTAGALAVSPRQARSFFTARHVDRGDCPRAPTGACAFPF